MNMPHTHNSETDVLIVGAGPTGLTMACELLRRGISCRVLDKAEAHGLTSRAMGVQARTLEVFDNMGIIERVLAKGVTGVNVNLYSGNTLLLHMDFRFLASDAIPYPYGVMLPQNITEELLIDRLHELGGSVERLQEVVNVQQDGDGVTVTVKDLLQDRSVRAKWLIGCDGSHSQVRKALGLAFEGSTYGEEYLLADVDLDWKRDPKDVYVWQHQTGQFAAMPLPGNHWRLFADMPITNGQDAPSASVELFQRLMRERTGDTTTTILHPLWLSNFKIHRRMVPTYRQQRVFLAGDSAHVHSPFGGQGMNTGIQDAYNLAWKLALVIQGKATDGLLDTYTTERMPIARKVLQDTHVNTGIFHGRDVFVRFLRDAVIVPVLQRQFAQRILLWKASELGIHYRTSPLSQAYTGTLAEKLDMKRWGHRGPRPGDRAPDGHCLRLADHSATSLFQEWRGTASHLLLFDGNVRTTENYAMLLHIAHQVESLLGDELCTHLVVSKEVQLDWLGSLLLDAKRTIHTHYGAGVPSLYVIRPDGYIGFHCQPARIEPLLQYLASLFQITMLSCENLHTDKDY